MRLFCHVPLALAICISVSFATEFINPPAEDDRKDSSVNAVYAKGATINIQWTPVDAILALTLFQLNKTEPGQFLPGLEYIATSLAPNATSFTWNVQTKKSLVESPIFYMNLFVQGETSGRANSHAFNISLPVGIQPQSSSGQEAPTSTLLPSASTKETSASLTVSATSTPSSPPNTTPTPAPISSTSPTSGTLSITATEGGLSTAAKLGIGIGVSAAVILGVAVGWLFFGRTGGAVKSHVPSTAAPPNYYEPKHDYVPQGILKQHQPGYAHELHQNTTPHIRYELPDRP